MSRSTISTFPPPTVPEIVRMVRAGTCSIDRAAALAGERGMLGLCSECDNKQDGDPEITGSLCIECFKREN